MDARRFANERGIKIYGPKKANNSDVALMGGFYAQLRGGDELFHQYSQFVFEKFFLRELDIERVQYMTIDSLCCCQRFQVYRRIEQLDTHL